MKVDHLPLLWSLVVCVWGGYDGGEHVWGEAKEGVLARTVEQILENQLAGCHVVLAASTRNSHMFLQLSRSLLEIGAGAGIVTFWESPVLQNATLNSSLQDGREQSGLWREGSTNCRALVLDFMSGDIDTAARLTNWVSLWAHPDTRLVAIGDHEGAASLLLHTALRNTQHALYLAGIHLVNTRKKSVLVWRRCGYCEEGSAGVEVLGGWDVEAAQVSSHPSLYRDRPEDYNGHKFRLVENDYFPYTGGDKLTDQPGTLVVHKDSLGTRIIRAMAASLNFTYEVRQPVDRKWGNEVEPGIWNGLVGTLMREDADLCLDLTVTPHRATVVQFGGAYIDESVVIVSAKPRPPPEYLSLIRPFTWPVWVMAVGSVVVWGSVVWLLQQLWPPALGGRVLDFKSSLFYSLGILLEDPPDSPPKNLTGQMLVGWWLATCLLITSFYRSLLISHLVVQGKSPVINTMEDLVGREGMTWGTRRMTGILMTILSTSPDPVKRRVFEGMQPKTIEEGMQLVLKGRYAYFYSTYYMKLLLATKYTDATGEGLMYTSKAKYDLYSGNTFTFRHGAPFLENLSTSRQRLMEAGLIPYWMDEVINTRVREDRKKELGDVLIDSLVKQRSEGGQVVLGLQHLAGAFIILFLGYFVGLLTFLVEQRVR